MYDLVKRTCQPLLLIHGHEVDWFWGPTTKLEFLGGWVSGCCSSHIMIIKLSGLAWVWGFIPTWFIGAVILWAQSFTWLQSPDVPTIISMYLRLCSVLVKYFLKNKYFLEMLFLENENIFKCLVALWKLF